MKFVLAFLLCGLACCLASPTCDDSEVEKCGQGREVDYDRFYPESEAEMESFCRDVLKELDCQLAFTDRCPNTLLGAMRLSLVMYKETFEKVCDKEGSLRKKLLEKAACINREERASKNECAEKIAEKEFCKKIEPILQCSKEELNKRCGSDGSELYTEIFKPQFFYKKIFCKGIEDDE